MVMQRSEPKQIPLELKRLAIYYTLDKHHFRGHALSSFSVFSGLLGGRKSSNHGDDITPRIILSGMPKSCPNNVGMIASVSTYAELADGSFPDNVNHIFLHVPDATAKTTDQDGLNFVIQMRDFLKDNPDKKVLIHCQYGKGRSVMLLAALLLTCPQEAGYHGKPFEDAYQAYEYIRSKRSQALNEPDKRQKTESIVKLYTECKISDIKPTDDSASYLASLEGKDALRRLSKFIQLACITVKLQDEIIHTTLQDFFHDMLASTDGKWYENLLEKRGYLFNIVFPDIETKISEVIKTHPTDQPPSAPYLDQIRHRALADQVKNLGILGSAIDDFTKDVTRHLQEKGYVLKSPKPMA